MSAQLMTKWYGIHKLQETMGALQLELARLAAHPVLSVTLVCRVELKMAGLMAALQWFEYHNKLNVDCDRLEQSCEYYDACHLKEVPHIPGQTHMHGIVTVDIDSLSLSVNTNPSETRGESTAEWQLSDSDVESEPETLPSLDSVPDSSPESAEVTHHAGG